jgi:hypothetical protein
LHGVYNDDDDDKKITNNYIKKLARKYTCFMKNSDVSPMSSKAASITAAPFNMVAMRMSWPGQSTKDTCL